MRVAAAGLRLLEDTRQGCPALVLLFALTHDSMRRHDGADSAHGSRAAEFLKSLNGERLQLPPDALEILFAACTLHSVSRTSEEPTTAICWNADRLNFWRLGLEPDPQRLSTAAARELRLAWAQELQNLEYNWTDLYRAFEAEEERRGTGLTT